MEQEKLARAAFHSLKGVGSRHLRHLIACFGSGLKAWEAPQRKYTQIAGGQDGLLAEVGKARYKLDLGKLEASLSRLGIRLVIPEEAQYPVLLTELADAPPLLYYRGTLHGEAEALAVVGSRQATVYGKSAAKVLARAAAAQGIVVVSGLARGIDTAAHQGALESGGVTWAFLGSGLDQIYPAENKKLAEQIELHGALLSEYPPGTPPKAGNFPARNRLISGCSRGVLVVEAAERSGALITVDFALEQGREVFAVPGPIFSKQSRGTHNLLRQGAKIVEDIEDIRQELPSRAAKCSFRKNADETSPTQAFTEENFLLVDSEFALILEQLSDVPLHIDHLAVHVQLPAAKIPLALLELQLAGKILQLPGQYYVLARKC